MSKRKRSGLIRGLNVKRCLLMSSPMVLAALASQDLNAQQMITVNNMTELRNAIDTVNGTTTNDVITMNAATYTLTGAALDNANASGDLDITKASGDLTIIAATGATVNIDANSVDRVFHINAGAGVTVTIQDVTIQNGAATDDGTTAGEARGGGILLEQGDLTLTNVTVDGNSALGARGSNGSNGATGQAGTVGTAGEDGRGGAVYAAGGTVSISGSIISNNAVQGGDGGDGGDGGADISGIGGAGAAGSVAGFALGGGIYAAGGTLTVQTTTISGNTLVGGNGGAGGAGGGGFTAGGDGAVAGNGGFARGAGIFNDAGAVLNVRSSTISGNGCSGGDGGAGGDGGGITASTGGDGGNGGNAGGAAGGAIFISSGTVGIVNSTVSTNTSTGGDAGDGGDGGSGYASSAVNGDGGDGGNGGNGQGAGIEAVAGTLDIQNSTIAFGINTNGATGAGGVPNTPGTGGVTGATGSNGGTFGGGITVIGATVTIDSSIVSDNQSTTGPNISGTVAAMDSSLVEDDTGLTITTSTNNVLNQDPVLGALQNNGGPTLTHNIDSASAARNVGSNPLSLSTDQVGNQRDDGNGVDMGSVEFGSTPPPTGTADPVVTDPAAVTTVNAASYDVQGTAVADSLVRIYSDLDNNGTVNGADAVVGTLQLTGGATAFSVSVALTQDLANDFLATADDGTTGESGYVNVPTITEDSTAPTGTVVTDPAAATNTVGTTYDIQGTAEAGSLVQVYSDFNDNGLIDGADAVVASGTATGGNFSITTPITQSTMNNFTVTASDAIPNESAPVDVPTITETTAPPIAAPTVTDPASAVTVDLASYDIAGTAQADSLVRIYTDLNNDGFINGADAMVGSQQLTGGGTAFSVSVALTQNAANNFLATAEDAGMNESLPADVPTITDNAGGTTGGGGGGGGGDGGGCSTDSTNTGSWMLLLGALAALATGFRNVFRRREEA